MNSSRLSTFLTRYFFFAGAAGVGTSIAGGAYVADWFYKDATTLQDKIIDTTIGAITGASTGFIVGTMGTITAPIIIPTICANLIIDKLRTNNQ